MLTIIGDGKINLKCPMKSDGYVFGFCEEAKCGWWNKNLGECSVTSISAVAFMLEKVNETIKLKVMR